MRQVFRNKAIRLTHRRLMTAALVATAIAGGVVVAYDSATEFVRVDLCLDSGGSYEYELDTCDSTESRPAR